MDDGIAGDRAFALLPPDRVGIAGRADRRRSGSKARSRAGADLPATATQVPAGRLCRRTARSRRRRPRPRPRCRRRRCPTRGSLPVPEPGTPTADAPCSCRGRVGRLHRRRAAVSQSAMRTAAPSGLTCQARLWQSTPAEEILLTDGSQGPPAGRMRSEIARLPSTPLVQTAVRLPEASTATCGSLEATPAGEIWTGAIQAPLGMGGEQGAEQKEDGRSERQSRDGRSRAPRPHPTRIALCGSVRLEP